uniref:Uncharacterized protein n=1 Tax=Tanacetum cinerariifolium TaxID=118510 RepID=A0A6L2KUA1_TANCI|nr:hypothetical protein [Tanacetum cinerariifolium]
MLLVQGEILQVDRQELLNATTVKVKDIWLGNALSLSDQEMQHDLGIPAGQAQIIIPHNAAFQTEDLDTYDSNCDDLSNAQAVLMANISNYGSDVISEAQQVSMILSMIEQMSEQIINHVNNWERANKDQNNESITAKLERYKERVKTFEQRLNIDLSCREKIIDSQIDDMIKEKLALKEKVDSLKQNLSKQIKEKECLLETFNVFQNKSKEKENKYLETKINLEKKIKELSNIVFKVEWKFPVNYLRSESYEECLNLDAEFSKSKQEYTDLLKKNSQLEKHRISLKVSMQLKQEVFQNDESCVYQNALEMPEYFKKNDLKAQLKDKDTAICKLEDTIKSLRKNNKEEIVDHDRCDLATINEELENSVAKLLSENERLCKEINHVKQVFKDQFDLIKQTCVLQKEQSDSLINKLNLKSGKNKDLKAQIQDKVFVITSLKNDLRKLKGKSTIDNAAQIPSAITVAPGMFKLDLEPLAPKLVHNRESHNYYLKHTQE